MRVNALLIVDIQKAYFNNEALQARQQSLVHSTNELVALMRQYDMPVFNIRTEHDKDGTTWTLNMKDDGEGYLFKGDEDTGNITGLDTQDTIEVIKTRDSSFFQTNLANLLRAMDVYQLIICGVSTHTCIFQTASDAYAHNFIAILARDAIASHNPEYDQQAFETLRTEYRQRVLTNKDIAEILK